MTVTLSLQHLADFANRFWNYVGDQTVFAFHGAMGAGKTTVISALCTAKGVEDVTSSPTFSIINEYGYVENGVQQQLFHIDLYRLKNGEEAVAAGVEECLFSGALCFIEWPEIASQLFDEDTTHLIITPSDETTRIVRILSAAGFTTHTLTEHL